MAKNVKPKISDMMKKIIFVIGFLICSFATAFAQESDCTSGDRLKSTILFYTSNGEQSVDSVFTVAPGTKVIFRGGNLLYHPHSHTYKIADEQYDYVGGQGVASVDDNVVDPKKELYDQGTLYYEDVNGDRLKCSNNLDSLYSTTYMGWRDLHKFYVLDSILDKSIDIDGKEYRALSESEYTYLFFTRPNAKSLRGRARIKLGNREGLCNDSIINGFILLPDNWNPSILPNKQFKSDITSNTHYTDNVYTRNEWKILEKQGAIFLPAGGSVDKEGSKDRFSKKCNRSGFYWLTATNATQARTLEFGGYYFNGKPAEDPTYQTKNKAESRLIRLVEVVK